jgi:hypothetical protein
MSSIQPGPGEPFEAEFAEPPRAGSLTLIATLAIIAGALGTIGVCLAGSFVATTYNAAAPTDPGASAPAHQRFQYELQKEWAGITERFWPGLATFTVLQSFVMVLLLVGGIRLLRRTPAARRFMLMALLVVLLFETARSGMYLIMMLEMMPSVDTSMHQVLKGSAGQSPQAIAILKRMAQGITVVAILVALVWPAIKLLFYGWAARYLTSEEAIAKCQG